MQGYTESHKAVAGRKTCVTLQGCANSLQEHLLASIPVFVHMPEQLHPPRGQADREDVLAVVVSKRSHLW